MKHTGQNNSEKTYLNALSHVFPVTRQEHIRILTEVGSAKAFYECPAAYLKGYLQPAELKRLQSFRDTQDPERLYQELEKKGISHTGYGCPDYPEELLQIPGAPLSLYYRGDLPDPEKPCVAIIGARACSAYGKHTAEHFAEVLVRYGVQIVSGLAMGVDGIAQGAAVRAGGRSFGVLGSGVDVIYPQSNRNLYDTLVGGRGGVLSEYPPGTQAKPAFFPPRNRIISGLSDILLVVEAREKSGTMITVDMALEQGKEIFAVPGRVTDELSAGCHKLIKQGAALAASPTDLLESLEKILASRQAAKRGKQPENRTKDLQVPEENTWKKSAVPPGLSPEEKNLWNYLGPDPKETEEIWQEMCEHKENPGEIRELMVLLMSLYAAGYVEREEGGFHLKQDLL